MTPGTSQFVATPIRVLVVDDSAVSRRVVSEALAGDPEIVVAGTASNGLMALKRIQQCSPDVVTLNIEMPEMNGLDALRSIRRDYPKVRVIMISAHTTRGSALSLEALALGASDCIGKRLLSEELNGGSAPSVLRDELAPRIKRWAKTVVASRPAGVAPAAMSVAMMPPSPPPPAKSLPPDVLAIGVSTGGPTALHEVLPQLPSNFPLPVLVVQHMPAMFTRLLAERLSGVCSLRVQEARDGMAVEGGNIYIAPGDFHMRLGGSVLKPRVVLDQGPPENSCRPAVDVLFRSVAEMYGGGTIAAVLTGMGQDGQLGCEVLRAKGAYILAQDEATSVVWGMPGGIVRAGLADKVLPLASIIPDVLTRCQALLGYQMRFNATAKRK